MKEITGDLIELAKSGQFDVIVHGCNCFHVMGAGIARQIRLEFPEAVEADLCTIKGDASKLGTFSEAKIKTEVPFVIVNAYTQYYFGSGGPHVDYDAVRRVFKSIKQSFAGGRIGIPKIGAGLGGGNWERISSIITEELHDEDVTLVLFNS